MRPTRAVNFAFLCEQHFVYFEQLYPINFPTIIHRENNAVQNANLTQKLIKQLCDAWKDKGDSRLISYTISIEYPDKQVLFSIAGHVLDLLDWFDHTSSVFPDGSEDMGDWCEEFAEFLYKYPPAEDIPNLRCILDHKGIINFKRVFVDNTKIHYYFNEDEKSLMAEIKIERSEEATLSDITSGKLEIAVVHEFIESQCSLCNDNYLNCNCSKYLDSGVTQIMKKVNRLGSIWTNRKA